MNLYYNHAFVLHMVTSIRFDEAENALITAAATRAGTSKHEFMRDSILRSSNPSTVVVQPVVHPQTTQITNENPANPQPTPSLQAVRGVHFNCAGCHLYYTNTQFCDSCSKDKETNICLNCCSC